jgi:hexosaminidase
MRTLHLVVSALILSTCFAAAQTPSTLTLMPVPAKIQLGAGRLAIDQLFTVALTGAKDARLDSGIPRFLDQLTRQTGMPLNKDSVDSTKATLVIRCTNGGRKVQELGEDESYSLEVTPARATLTAPNPLGVLHGLQTFLQLVEPSPAGFAVPVLTIHDEPRFAWRGLLIDVCRHFMPLDVMKRNLDGMAALKLNVLHWHLSDDEGFRVESKKFPKLHEMGSEGQYYTQAEIREFVGYARERGIRIVPEFEMPGHSRSIVAGYPELASQPGPYPPGRVARDATALDVTQEKTYKFLDKLIGEMAGLFPDAYLHIGGDEVDDKPWNSNPKIQEFIHAHGMKDNRDLQAYFNKRLEKIVGKHGKIMMGWDEVLHPDLPKTVLVQSWRGQDSLAAAAKQGYRGLLSNGYYLDLMWPAARHYAVDPMSGAAAALTPDEAKRILGGEACMWAEYITPETIDSRIWPRLAAIAERFWSPQDVKDPKSMYQRLDEVSWHLGWLGLTHESNYVPMLRRLAGMEDIRSLRVLTDAVEPTKDYTRSEVYPQPPVKSVPLNRLVDAARPESAVARRFAELVGNYIESGYKDSAAEAQIRAWLVKWQGNHPALKPLPERSFLLTEDQPLSEDLATLSAAGLRALDAIGKNQPLPEAWRTEQLAVVERSMKPRANLLIMVAPSIQKLIEAASPQTASHP